MPNILFRDGNGDVLEREAEGDGSSLNPFRLKDSMQGVDAHNTAATARPFLLGATAQHALAPAVSADGHAVRVAADRQGVLYTRGQGRTIEATPPVTATSYAALDSVGGKLALPNAFREGVGIFIQAVRVVGVPSPRLKLILFRADPAASSFVNDAPVNLAFADHGKIAAVIDLVSVQQIDANTHVAHWAPGSPGLGLLMRPAGGTTLFAALQATGPMTTTGASDFHLLIEAYDE